MVELAVVAGGRHGGRAEQRHGEPRRVVEHVRRRRRVALPVRRDTRVRRRGRRHSLARAHGHRRRRGAGSGEPLHELPEVPGRHAVHLGRRRPRGTRRSPRAASASSAALRHRRRPLHRAPRRLVGAGAPPLAAAMIHRLARARLNWKLERSGWGGRETIELVLRHGGVRAGEQRICSGRGRARAGGFRSGQLVRVRESGWMCGGSAAAGGSHGRGAKRFVEETRGKQRGSAGQRLNATVGGDGTDQ